MDDFNLHALGLKMYSMKIVIGVSTINMMKTRNGETKESQQLTNRNLLALSHNMILSFCKDVGYCHTVVFGLQPKPLFICLGQWC